MGFGENASRKAIRFTNNESVQAATEWIIQRMDDPTLNDPEPNITIPESYSQENSNLDEAINKLVEEFQFTPFQAKYGLVQTKGNLNKAINWLFENLDKVPTEEIKISISDTSLKSCGN